MFAGILFLTMLPTCTAFENDFVFTIERESDCVYVLTIKNKSNEPARFWATGNMWGDNQFTCVFVDNLGKPQLCERMSIVYTSNTPNYTEVKPGEKYVIRVNFDDGTWKGANRGELDCVYYNPSVDEYALHQRILLKRLKANAR